MRNRIVLGALGLAALTANSFAFNLSNGLMVNGYFKETYNTIKMHVETGTKTANRWGHWWTENAGLAVGQNGIEAGAEIKIDSAIHGEGMGLGVTSPKVWLKWNGWNPYAIYTYGKGGFYEYTIGVKKNNITNGINIEGQIKRIYLKDSVKIWRYEAKVSKILEATPAVSVEIGAGIGIDTEKDLVADESVKRLHGSVFGMAYLPYQIKVKGALQMGREAFPTGEDGRAQWYILTQDWKAKAGMEKSFVIKNIAIKVGGEIEYSKFKKDSIKLTNTVYKIYAGVNF